MAERFDVVVVGLGPGGEEVAERLAEAGLRVAGVERELVGGECPYWGCVPSKTIIRAANALAEAGRIPSLAGRATVTPDWAPVARRLREVTDGWDDQVAVDRLRRLGGTLFRGEARLLGPGTVGVGDAVLEASRAVVIATGTSPAIPPIPGLAEVDYWTNRDLIEVERLPGSLLVLGGGAIGLELAQAVRRFGVEVTILEAMDRVLALEEPEASDVVARALASEGVRVLTGAAARGISRRGGRIVVSLEGGREVAGDQLLVATGRRANLRALGLGAVGIDAGDRFVRVDDHMRAGPGVWAVGDVTGAGAFTHVAVYQARIAIRSILGRKGPGADYAALPRVTFTDPEIGAAGLTERQAVDRGLLVRTGVVPLSQVTRGFIHGPGSEGFIKLVEDVDRGVLVGGTSAGPSGGEVLSMLSVAIAGAIPTERLRNMIYAYPTFHRGVEAALQALAQEAPMPSG